MQSHLACALAVALIACGRAPEPRAAASAAGDRVASALDDYLRRAERAGFSGAVLVAVRGRVILERGYGWADADRGVRNRADTRFLVASITKTFTAAAIALLAVRGRLDWSDPISRHLRGVPPDKDRITIAQLLQHTSGLPDEYRGERAPDRESAERDILAAPLASAPGERWSYCNDGYVLLAVIIERASGQRYEEFVHRELMVPAGMTESSFRWEPAAPGAVALGHNGDLVTHPAATARGWGQRGAGGLITTVGDLHLWVRALDAGSPVPRAAQDRMLAAPVPARPGLRDGMGWFVVDTARGTRALYHGGNDTPAGFTAELRRYIAEDVVTVLAVNAMQDDVGLNRAVTSCIEAVLFGGACDLPPPVSARPRDPGLLGVYALPSGGRLRVGAAAGGLFVAAEGQDAIDLVRPVGDERRVALRAASQRAETALRALIGPAGAACDEVCRTDRDAVAGFLATRRAAPTSWQLLGTAPVSADAATTFVRLRHRSGGDEIARLIWDGADLVDLLPARHAAATPLLAQPGGGFITWSPLLARGAVIRFASRELHIYSGGSVVKAAGISPPAGAGADSDIP